MGISLADEQLDSISGGIWSSDDPISSAKYSVCGAKIKFNDVSGYYPCQSCGNGFILVCEDDTVGGGAQAS